MKYAKHIARWLVAITLVVALAFVFRGSTNDWVYWIAFPPVKIIQVIVGWQHPSQGAVELSSLTLGAPLTALYWYLLLSILQGKKK